MKNTYERMIIDKMEKIKLIKICMPTYFTLSFEFQLIFTIITFYELIPFTSV